MNNRKNETKTERMQERRDAGSVAKRFPDVVEIVVAMTCYNQRGMKSMLRTFHFSPGSDAFFKVACLSKSCVDGGYDLTPVITEMIRKHSPATEGEMSCKGMDSSGGNSDIVYKVAIQYNVPAGA